MRKRLITTALLCTLAAPAGALAAGGGYGSQPGYTVANSHTICAGHGAFGAFSGTPGVIEEYVDADQTAGISLGSETGPTNSGLCGNPQS
jgi:hypothetical protein